MKSLLSVSIALVVGCFTFGCSSTTSEKDVIEAQPRLSLVSPEGVRIANSVDELANLPYAEENGHIVDAPVTITRIEYSSANKAVPFTKSKRFDDGRAIQALVHFKTATGEVGQGIIEMPIS